MLASGNFLKGSKQNECYAFEAGKLWLQCSAMPQILFSILYLLPYTSIPGQSTRKDTVRANNILIFLLYLSMISAETYNFDGAKEKVDCQILILP